MEFLHTLLRPLIDTYTFSAFCLRKLVGRSLSERDLVQEILSEIKTNLDQGIVNYGKPLRFPLQQPDSMQDHALHEFLAPL